jgi:hypothetical protein
MLPQREARSSFLWALLQGVRGGRMSSTTVESILAAIARAHSVAVGVMTTQQWFMQRQEASCIVITVPVLRFMQAGLLPTEVALLLHRELPCDLSVVRLNCTLPAMMMVQQQQEERLIEFGHLCGYATEMLVCLALLHARDTQKFAAACLHQAYFTFGSALRSASSLSSATAGAAAAAAAGTATASAASSSFFFNTYSRLRGAGGALREGQGTGVMCADDVVGLYSMELQV